MGDKQKTESGPIKDAFKQLGAPRSMLLGLQHMFAMFGATILVPLITGMSVQVTLIGVGLGTLVFHFFSKGRVPVFLGSSFAFLAGIQLVTDPVNGIFAGTGLSHTDKLAYATGGIFAAGFLYLLLALAVKLVGAKKVMSFLPPVVTGPIVILIGLMLAPFAISQSSGNMLLALVALSVVIVASVWGKGMFKIVPVVLGLTGGYAVALILHFAGVTNPNGTPILNFAAVSGAGGFSLPPFFLPRFAVIPILVMIPAAIATIAEHIADMVILSDVCGEDFTEKPGLSRTLIGDGLATTFSGFIGAPATTTYSENVGVVVLTKIHDAKVVMLAAIYAVILGFLPLFDVLVRTIPTSVIGGVSFVLYGMIAAVGIRTLVDNRVDIGETRNLFIVAVVLVTGLGLRFGPVITVTLGGYSVPIDRLGIAIGALLGVFLNIVLPGERFAFDKKKKPEEPLVAAD